jgi:hypothetical protein
MLLKHDSFNGMAERNDIWVTLSYTDHGLSDLNTNDEQLHNLKFVPCERVHM